MKCEGNFIFRGIEQKEGGEFVNDRGQKITYNPTFQIKVDEIQGSKTEERTFKFPHSNKELWEKFKALKIYEEIIIAFDIELYKTSVKLVPTDVICENEPTEDNEDY